jgi:hypothetical protein
MDADAPRRYGDTAVHLAVWTPTTAGPG